MMKAKYLYIVLILFVCLLNSCKKAAPFKDVIFFTGTESSPATKFTIDAPSSMGISVTSSAKMTTDTKVAITINPDLIAAYNKKTGKTYQLPPDGSYQLLGDTITIKSGTNVSESAKFSIVAMDKFVEGTNYCVPITITDVKGDISVLEPSRTIFIVINRTIITQAVNLAGSNYFTVPSFAGNDAVKSLSEVTLECRVFVTAFQAANPYISSVMGIEENYLLRFGDVSIAKNQIQLAGGLVNGKKFPVTGSTLFSTGQWYHVAVVYNGASESIYVNGILDSSTQSDKGTVDFSDTYMGGFHVGFSSDGRKLNGYVSEARVWSKALTSNELQDNLCYVDPTTNGLVAYWRFNATDAITGNATDLTGHGYTAVASSAATKWVTAVRCPF